MGVLSMKESREYRVFQLFSESTSYISLVSKVEQYNEEHPEEKLFASPQEKKALKDCFQVFNEARAPLMRNGPVDFDNPNVLDSFTNIFEQKLPVISHKRLCDSPQGLALKKANIGCMLGAHVENMVKLGKDGVYSKKENRKPIQEMVNSYRPLGRSNEKRVINTDATYKPISVILRERAMREKNIS